VRCLRPASGSRAEKLLGAADLEVIALPVFEKIPRRVPALNTLKVSLDDEATYLPMLHDADCVLWTRSRIRLLDISKKLPVRIFPTHTYD
jgi:hypothetical protein